MKENPVARQIVANLAYRYRRAKRLHLIEEDKPYSVSLRAQANVRSNEAWNAYIASKRILFGNTP